MLDRRGVDVVVFEEQAECATRAREDGHHCVEALVSDTEAAHDLPGTEVFVMMDLDPLRVDRLAKHLRRRFPSARIIAPDLKVEELTYLETFTGEGQALRIGMGVLAEAVVAVVEEHMAKRSTERLVEVLQAGGGGDVAVFTHDDPDPDAIAAGMGMLRICEELGLSAVLYHGGRLNRLENRFFARLVDAPLSSITPEEAETVVTSASRVVLVDAGRPGEHNVLPPRTVPHVVLDHHSTNREVRAADYSDVRPNVGSTSTMVTTHIQQMGIVPDPKLAAALLFGLRTDTDHLRRNAFPSDMRASAYLASLADQALLNIVEHPPLAPEVLDVIGRGILSRERHGDHMMAWCGEVASRDELPPVADFLLQEENVAAVFVFGRVGDKVLVSARSVVDGPHVGNIVKEALGDIGAGGGHPTMGGGAVTLRLGVGLDVDRWVREDLFNAILDAAGVRTE